MFADKVVLILGRTKRGLEEKVVLSDRIVIDWCRCFVQIHPTKLDAPVMHVSYTTFLKWIHRLPKLLGVEDLELTTHSLRRSGASALILKGIPFSDVLLYGRWHTERAAREYIRRGEVAITTAKAKINPVLWNRIKQWCGLSEKVWQLQQVTSGLQTIRVTTETIHQLEKLLFT